MSVRIASLTLEGFKSFAGKVELAFPGDIIAIVGPNGAGKSNVCDAIAWVLGEQSARSLRSQNMGEVIFAGSPNRQPAGAAQVTLVLKPRNQPDSHLEISRRLLRDGTSEYRLQGKRVRLKDIVDKLAEAGLGTRAYAIIEQGRVAQVLSAKPADRRALFEEAAGIGHYRIRRQEAELKLAQTRANLERVEDIVAEVKRELTVIRRQAKQAQRFAELKEEARALGQKAAWLKLQQLQEQRGSLQAALAQAKAARAATAAQLARLEAELSASQREWEKASAWLSQLQGEHKDLEVACHRLEVEEAALRRELASLRAREQEDRQAALQVQKQMGEEAAAEAELTAKLQLAQKEEEELLAVASQAQATAEEVEKRAQLAEAQAQEARAALLRLVSAAAEARNRFHRLQVAGEQLAYQQKRLKAEKERLATHLQKLAQEEAQAAKAEAAAGAALQKAQTKRRQLQETLEASRRQLAELTRKRDELEHSLWQVRHELEAIQRARAQLRALPESLATVLEDRLLAGTVADYLNPPPALAKLLDDAFGELLALPVVEGEEAARTLAEHAAKLETLEVAIRDPRCPGRPHPLLSAAGVAEAEQGWLSLLLPLAVVTESLQEAKELSQNPELVVLVPPRLLRQGQRLRLGDGKKAVMGALQLKNREQELAGQKANLEQTLEELSRQLTQVLQTASEQEQALAALDQEVRRATEALAEATSRHQARHRERARLEREMEAFHVEEARLAEEETRTQQELAEAELRARELEERAQAAESQMDQANLLVGESRKHASQARTEAERARSAALLATERAQHLGRELARHRQLQRQLEAQQQRLTEEAANLQVNQSQVAAQLAETRAQLEKALQDARLWAEKITKAQKTTEAFKKQVAAQQEDVASARQRDQEAQEAVHGCQLRLAELTAQISQAQQAAGEAPPEDLPPAEALPQLLARQKELEEMLAAMGPVNELAVAQEQELSARFRFLSEQEKDLKRSLASLQGSIRELDATCQERFLTTLAEANRHFGEIFRELFGGGEAYVALTDPESPLDSGVDVRVRPPGKHTQSVLLLSGGEKALAAVALLLALFRIKPSPFCVLDEVDAPLDDLNVERLCQHLKAQAPSTQFLLITHNRRTMAYANVLYGVTMEEPGVSRVVSVRLEEP